MKRIGTIWGAAMLLLLGMGLTLAPNAAHAQSRAEDTPELSRDWTARIGLFVFNNQAARNKVGAVGISGLVERTVYYGLGYDVNIGIGYNGYDDVYSVPLTVAIIGHQNRLRYGAGAGYSFGKRISGAGSNGAVLTLILGWQLSSGRNPTSADLRYNFIAGSDNELDGFSLTYGIKF